jgi:hypothetical protein
VRLRVRVLWRVRLLRRSTYEELFVETCTEGTPERPILTLILSDHLSAMDNSSFIGVCSLVVAKRYILLTKYATCFQSPDCYVTSSNNSLESLFNWGKRCLVPAKQPKLLRQPVSALASSQTNANYRWEDLWIYARPRHIWCRSVIARSTSRLVSHV